MNQRVITRYGDILPATSSLSLLGPYVLGSTGIPCIVDSHYSQSRDLAKFLIVNYQVARISDLAMIPA